MHKNPAVTLRQLYYGKISLIGLVPGDLVADRMPEPLEHAQVQDDDQDEWDGVAGNEERDLKQSGKQNQFGIMTFYPKRCFP